MKLQLKVASLEGVPEAYHDLYVEKAGEFLLEGVDFSEMKNKLAQFRDNNRKLHGQVEEMNTVLAPFKDAGVELDYEAYKAMAEAAGKYQAGGAAEDPEKFEAELAKRLASKEKEFEKRLGAKDELIGSLQETNNGYKSELDGYLVERDVLGAANKVAKVRPGADLDLLQRARSVWKRGEDGSLVARDANGEAIYHDGDEIKPEQWVRNLIQEAPHLFVDQQGGGSGGGAPGAGSGRTIDASDPMAIGRNLKDLASGKVTGV